MQYLTLDEVKAVIENAADDSERLAFKVGYWHGLRATEICGMVGASIQDGYVDVQRLKRSKRTRQPFIKHADPVLDESKELHALAKTKGPRQKLFGDWDRQHLYYVFEKAAIKAGLPKHKRHPHVLKHSIAMATIKAAGIENVRQWLGHKSIASTGEYLKVSDDQAAVAITAAVGGSK